MSELRVSAINNLSGQPLITPTSLGLDQVDNTSDLDKPISTATQAALDAISEVPAGGLQYQSLQKNSGVDADVSWLDSERTYIQRGVTTPGVQRILSRTGGTVDPSVFSEIIQVTSGRSALLSVNAIARSTAGLTRSFTIKAVVKNGAVLSQTATSEFSETGTSGWTLVVQWSGSLLGYVLAANGSGTENVTWETAVKVVGV